MAERNIIVVGTSSGGIDALIKMVQGLPVGFPASVFVVCHIPPGGRSVLPDILSRSGKLLATHAQAGEHFQPGQIYVAPPDRHMLLAPDGRIQLTRGARENHHRPAVDPLFRSAARYYGSRVIGVILTGALYNGTAGLLAIRAAGGLAVVQDPSDALVAAMPQNAVDIAGADHLVSAVELAPLLTRLIKTSIGAPGGDGMDPIETMPEVVEQDMAKQIANRRRGDVSVLTCPECGGSLWQVDQALPRFRCHVGHAYNGEALLADQTLALEAALWTAVRGFREKAVLSRQLEAVERGKGNLEAADRFREQAEQSSQYGELILKHVLHAEPVNGAGPGDPDVQDSTP